MKLVILPALSIVIRPITWMSLATSCSIGAAAGTFARSVLLATKIGKRLPEGAAVRGDVDDLLLLRPLDVRHERLRDAHGAETVDIEVTPGGVEIDLVVSPVGVGHVGCKRRLDVRRVVDQDVDGPVAILCRNTADQRRIGDIEPLDTQL